MELPLNSDNSNISNELKFKFSGVESEKALQPRSQVNKSFVMLIMLKHQCILEPLEPHIYIVKLGYTVVFIILLFVYLIIDYGYLLEPPAITSIYGLYFEQR